MPYRLIRPLVFRFDAERAHGLTIAALKMLPETGLRETSPRLRTRVAVLALPSPVGLHAGFPQNPAGPDATPPRGLGLVPGGRRPPRPPPAIPPPTLLPLAVDAPHSTHLGLTYPSPHR